MDNLPERSGPLLGLPSRATAFAISDDLAGDGRGKVLDVTSWTACSA